MAAPSSICNYLGVILNTRNSTLSVLTDKQTKILKKCNEVYKYIHITRWALQFLPGSLILIHKCVRPTRYFVNRLLEAFKSENIKNVKVTADIAGLLEFLPAFNGTATCDHITIEYTESLEIDTCLTHVVGVWNNVVFSVPILQRTRT